jgi:hypothetical protein
MKPTPATLRPDGQSRPPIAPQGGHVSASQQHNADASEARSRRGVLDWFDRQIVQYVLLWAPYGTLYDEDIYPKFGMSARALIDRYARNVSTLILAANVRELDETDRTLLADARRWRSVRHRPAAEPVCCEPTTRAQWQADT